MGKTHPNLNILQFLTGLRRIPPIGFSRKINIAYHADNDKVLPESSACFNMLHLPTSAPSQSIFDARFDQAVLYSLNYFGQE